MDKQGDNSEAKLSKARQRLAVLDAERAALKQLIARLERRSCTTESHESASTDQTIHAPDIKPNTRRNMKQARTFLLEFTPPGLPLADFTQGHAEDFRRFLLEKGQAESTVRRRCKRAKQFFAAAIKRRIIADNPFDGIPIANVANTDRQRFIDRHTITSVLDACPDTKWQLIFALARYGGLRIPSELEGMTWEDLNWVEGNRFTVRSPKTAHIDGKAQRSVPMFPELIPFFRAALDEADPDEGHVFPVLGKRNDLRTQAHRIIKRAGIEPWPRVFSNLRSSRETELVEEFPVHVVTDWIGNSPDVAKMHYLQTHEEHFSRAAGNVYGTGGGQNLHATPGNALQGAGEPMSEPVDTAADSDEIPVAAGICENGLAPHTFCGSNTLLAWLKRVHAFEQGLLAA